MGKDGRTVPACAIIYAIARKLLNSKTERCPSGEGHAWKTNRSSNARQLRRTLWHRLSGKATQTYHSVCVCKPPRKARLRGGTYTCSITIGFLLRAASIACPVRHIWRVEIDVSLRQKRAPISVDHERDESRDTRGGSIARQTHPHGGPAKQGLRPTQRRELVAWVQSTFAVSCVRACHLAPFSGAAWYRRSTRDDQARACPGSGRWRTHRPSV